MSTQQSYVHGASETPLLYKTIGQALRDAVDKWGDREALIVRHQNLRYTYNDLYREAEGFAAGLLALGLTRGDRVGIWAPNCAEWTITQFATALAGIVLVNINPAYRTNELEYALNKVGAKALVTASTFKTSNYISMLRDLAPELDRSQPGALHAARLPHLKTVIRIGADRVPGCYAFTDVAGLAGGAERDRLAELAPELTPDDPINIQFTSGTTGRPKGATLTHHNILNNGYFLGEAMRFTEHDRLCIPVPLYHCFGMVMGNLNCLTHGSAMIYPSDAFDPQAVLETVDAEKCTALYGVPTMFIAVLDHPDREKYNVSNLRTGVMAGAPCPIEVMRRVVDKLHMDDVTIAYGMTETSPVSFQSSIDDPLEKRVTTVGRIHPHVEVKVVDAEGRVTPRGVQGEILTRGYSVMLGYWDDPEKTAESIDHGRWMHTGDLGVIDEDGYCRIVGRVKDMVIRGGDNVYPREIEEYLYSHPKIADAQVFGVPDHKYGEEICVWVKLKAGEVATADDITGFCKGQIAHYKVPRYVRFVDAFPMTVTGKIQKFVMRDEMIKELALVIEQTA